MYKILQRIDRIRASGYATINVPSDSPHYQLDGKRLPVKEISTPDYKRRVIVLFEGVAIDFCMSEILRSFTFISPFDLAKSACFKFYLLNKYL